MPIKTRGGSGAPVNRDLESPTQEKSIFKEALEATPRNILMGLLDPTGMTRLNLATVDKVEELFGGSEETMERARNRRGRGRAKKKEGGSEPSETRNINSSAKFIPQELSDLRDLLSTPPEDIGELEAAVAEQDDEAMSIAGK